MRLVWILFAAIVAAVAAGWVYARREEPVPGRMVPAFLRALALFLVLAGLALPAIVPTATHDRGPVVLLDVSRSMALPARAPVGATRGGSRPGAGPSRMDSARRVLRDLRPERVVLFGEEPRPVPIDSAMSARPSASRSRLLPALETVALSGADRVLVLGDGEWEARATVEAATARLGLELRELRVAAPVGRIGLADLAAPSRARVGDSLPVAVDLLSSGPLRTRTTGRGGRAGPDSVTVELRRLDLGDAGTADSGTVVARARVAVPGAGRRASLRLAFLPSPPGSGDSEWRTYEARLPPGADPLEVADRRRFVVEIAAAAGGGVLVSTDPDWEARYLLPRLERAVLGGAVGFLRLGEARWAEIGTRPRAVDAGEVRRAVSAARLLVVQGAPPSWPGWLRTEVERHPRRLLFPRGGGAVPGTPVALAGPLSGEWYAASALPASPIARYLAGASLDELPPLRDVYRVDGTAGAWAPIEGRRNRRGETRPLLVAGGRGPERWAVATGEGFWRWAARDGGPRRVYDGLLAGLVGWLLEDPAPRDLELLEPALAGRPVRWRTAPGLADLGLVVRDEMGEERWSSRWERPPPEIAGPTLEPGRYTVTASGSGTAGPFRRERPLELAPDDAELVPRTLDDPLEVEGPAVDGGGRPARPRPIWPFVVATLILCGEWLWRRRIGLR